MVCARTKCSASTVVARDHTGHSAKRTLLQVQVLRGLWLTGVMAAVVSGHYGPTELLQNEKRKGGLRLKTVTVYADGACSGNPGPGGCNRI